MLKERGAASTLVAEIKKDTSRMGTERCGAAYVMGSEQNGVERRQGGCQEKWGVYAVGAERKGKRCRCENRRGLWERCMVR